MRGDEEGVPFPARQAMPLTAPHLSDHLVAYRTEIRAHRRHHARRRRCSKRSEQAMAAVHEAVISTTVRRLRSSRWRTARAMSWLTLAAPIIGAKRQAQIDLARPRAFAGLCAEAVHLRPRLRDDLILHPLSRMDDAPDEFRRLRAARFRRRFPGRDHRARCVAHVPERAGGDGARPRRAAARASRRRLQSMRVQKLSFPVHDLANAEPSRRTRRSRHIAQRHPPCSMPASRKVARRRALRFIADSAGRAEASSLRCGRVVLPAPTSSTA